MRWEYKTINFTKRSFFTGVVDSAALDEQLNNMGRDGWELVSAIQNPMAGVIAIFKRAK